jgi:uncharacterized delta-60 repeat protein
MSLAMGPAALALPGQRDATFGGDGTITTNFTTGNDEGVATVIQADGKILAGGSAAGFGLRFALARYNSNGSLDTTFGGGDGRVMTNFAAGPDWINWLALDANGKIVAVGGSGPASGADFRFALARYNDDGTLDTSFSGNGKLTTNFTAGYDYAEAVDIQTDGKIVVAGGAGGSGGKFAVARYNDDGTPDTSFHVDGKATANFTTGYDTAWAMALDVDEKIVAVGRAAGAFAVARFDTDGTLDPAFDGDGRVTTNFTTQVDLALELAIEAGQIVAAGVAGGSGGRFALARYDTDGSLDTTFSGDGKVITDFATGSDVAAGVGVQLDGKIVAVGWSGPAASSDYRFAVARYGSDGTLDTTFGGDGKITTNFTTGNDFAWGMAIDANGKVIAVGRAGGTGGRFALARYLTA